ncbi:MAG: type II toxin-antitoxin system RelE/ParE family toxin [Pirellulales bacterium]
MKYRLKVQPEAEADMNETFAWYEKQSEGLGSEFVACVEAVFDRIRHYPYLHAVTYKNVRQTLVRRFPYVVCYVVEEEIVDVIAVFHGHRDPAVWISRIG